MTTASALFQIDPGTGSYGAAGVAADAAASATVNCKIADLTGIESATIEWEIFGTHDSGVSAPALTLSGNPQGQIASFTVGSGLGQAYGIRLRVNGGAGSKQYASDGDTKTSAVYVLDNAGNRPAFVGEYLEADATHGRLATFNGLITHYDQDKTVYRLSTTTTDSTPTTKIAHALSADEVAHVKLIAIGRDATSGESASYECVATIEQTGGTAAVVGSVTADHTAEEDASWAATIGVSGANVIAQLTGDAANTVNWLLRLEVTVQ